MTRLLLSFVSCCTLTAVAAAQAPSNTSDSSTATTKGLTLAESGRCLEALPILGKSAPLTTDRQLKLRAGLATVRCALSLQKTDTAISTLLWLNRDFPTDPDVLYVTTHAFSDLSSNAAMRLARTAPQSYQAHELTAETLEMQGKWNEAAAEYEQILKVQPDLPGIHYRLGRIILSKPATPTTADDAKKEFELELKIDPKNAGAEYVLGELARQAQQWDVAIEHFSRAAKLDANFGDAFLGLGFCLSSVGRYAEAIPPLQTAVKLQPANPTGHYQLTVAYGKTGRKEDAQREMTLFRETSDKALKEMHGENSPQQVATPPQ